MRNSTSSPVSEEFFLAPNFEGLNVTWLEGSTPDSGFLSIEDCRKLELENLSLTNISCWHHAPTRTPEAEVRVIVLAVMTVLSLIANLATIISLSTNKRRSTVYTLIQQLAISDLFVSFSCLLTECVWTYTVEWKAGNVMCKLVKYIQMVSLYVSTFVLVLIGVDRFVAVRYPLRHHDTHRRWCSSGIALVWTLSAILSIPQVAIFRVVKGPFVEEFYQCVTYGFYTAEWQEQFYTTFSLVSMFILPLLTLLFTYTSTFITLQKSERLFRDEFGIFDSNCAELKRRRLLRKAKIKSLKISLVIVVAFVVCWTPYFTTMLIYMFYQPDPQVSRELENWIFFFGMSNSLVNPIIYGAFHLCTFRSNKPSFSIVLLPRKGARLQYSATKGLSTRTTVVGKSIRKYPFVNNSNDRPNCSPNHAKGEPQYSVKTNSMDSSSSPGPPISPLPSCIDQRKTIVTSAEFGTAA